MAAGSKWHDRCYKCKECGCALNSSNLRDRDKEIYCNNCYAKKFGAKGFGFGGAGVSGADSSVVAVDPLHGTAAIDAEIQRKLNLKFDSGKEASARAWLEKILDAKFEEKTLHEALKSGVRLCQALNKIIATKPIKEVSQSKFAAQQRENISKYINACKLIAMNKSEIFETEDLFDARNMVQVIENLYALSRRAGKYGLPIIEGTTVEPSASASSSPPVSVAASKPVASTPVSTPAASSAAAASSSSAAASSSAVTVCPDCGSGRSGDFCPDCGYDFTKH